MNQDNSHDNSSTGQSSADQETERRNRENETGQQSQQSPQAGQSQQAETGQQSQQSDTITKPEDNFATDKQGSEGGSGFVGSSDDTSSDYLTKGENQDFAPEGQGASDTNAGTSDIETGQSSNTDATLDDGADTSQ